MIYYHILIEGYIVVVIFVIVVVVAAAAVVVLFGVKVVASYGISFTFL